VLDVIHRPPSEPGWGWKFVCRAPPLEGGGRTYHASVAAAEHAARQHFSLVAGHPVELEEVRRRLCHVRAELQLSTPTIVLS
jgi:hypothetical protein